ncbi:MAG: hypothetical protein Q8M20_14335 [Rhodocyclaceae bacterium]|nr:hypothetical protein [Rhodocyclaceae bacterium]MDZ4216179.1 hypothetical protein [Rhodocyclaceae bacterium]
MTCDKVLIGYAEFIALCHVDKPADFGGFRVEANGLYVHLPPAETTLTPEERAALTWHPTHQYDKPALPLPCTLGQLRAFVAQAGLLGCIDEEAVDVVLPKDAVQIDKSPTDACSKDEAVKVGAGTTAKHDWMTQAWSIGESWMLAEEKRTGTRPTVEQIAKHAEGELSTRVITGPRGKFLDWETIKREALTGITGRTKGDNFRNPKGSPQRKRGSPSK